MAGACRRATEPSRRAKPPVFAAFACVDGRYADLQSPVCSGHAPGYTTGMKTAVSLPDELFQAAERHARRSSKSRSRLYTDAIAEYLAKHAPDEVTEAMNRVVDPLGDTARDDFVSRAAQQALERSEW